MSENNILDTAKTLGFGTELEYTHISREGAARAIQSVVGGNIIHTGGSYDAWTVTAPDGRKWKAVSDGSLSGTSAEVVTPILHWDDLDTLQKVVRALRRAGAKTPACTSQHVHIGVEDFTAAQIANFARIWYKQEKLILKAVGTLPSRLAHYTKPTDREFIDRLEQMKPQTRQQLNIAWYGYANPRPAHYDSTRYRAINLNNVWTTGTVELRCYENNDVMGTRRFVKHKSSRTSSHYFHRKPCRVGVWQNQDAAFVLRYDFRKPPSRENMVISPSSSCGKGCIITPPMPE